MPTLYLVCGSPFSGKTTLAKKIVKKTGYEYISTDDIMIKRGFDLSRLNPIEEWEKTHKECSQTLIELMNKKLNIVLDDTNFLKKLRNRFKAIADTHKYKIVTVFMDVSLNELEERRKRAVKVKDRMSLDNNAFYPIVNSFEKPDETENTIIFKVTDNYDYWLSVYFNGA